MLGFFSVGSISHRRLWVVGGARTENLHQRMRHRAHCQPILYRIRARLVIGGPAPSNHICGRHTLFPEGRSDIATLLASVGVVKVWQVQNGTRMARIEEGSQAATRR